MYTWKQTYTNKRRPATKLFGVHEYWDMITGRKETFTCTKRDRCTQENTYTKKLLGDRNTEEWSNCQKETFMYEKRPVNSKKYLLRYSKKYLVYTGLFSCMHRVLSASTQNRDTLYPTCGVIFRKETYIFEKSSVNTKRDQWIRKEIYVYEKRSTCTKNKADPTCSVVLQSFFEDHRPTYTKRDKRIRKETYVYETRSIYTKRDLHGRKIQPISPAVSKAVSKATCVYKYIYTYVWTKKICIHVHMWRESERERERERERKRHVCPNTQTCFKSSTLKILGLFGHVLVKRDSRAWTLCFPIKDILRGIGCITHRHTLSQTHKHTHTHELYHKSVQSDRHIWGGFD